jgi:alkyl hydroperoxide reductase subunit AhpC
MVELGQLEKHYQDFAKRNLQVVVISNDDQPTAQKTQADFPHLQVVADTEQNMAKALAVIQAGVGPEGTDTNAPTTFLVDGSGTVRWLFRPDRYIVRLSPDELLAAVDANQGDVKK